MTPRGVGANQNLTIIFFKVENKRILRKNIKELIDK